MKRLILFVLLVLGVFCSSSFAFSVSAVDGFQVVNNIEGSKIFHSKIQRDGFRTSLIDYAELAEGNLYIRCTNKKCVFDNRYGFFDFPSHERNRNRGDEDTGMFRMYH